MQQATIKAIVAEVAAALTGRFAGTVLQLSPYSFVIDLRLRSGLALFISVDPSSPRIYLLSRRWRDLEKQSRSLSAFGQALRQNLGSATLLSVSSDEDERVVRISFRRTEETGDIVERVLIAQLTGRSANLFLVDKQGTITHRLRDLSNQLIGEHYEPPQTHSATRITEPAISQGSFESLSAAADDYYSRLEQARAFAAQMRQTRARLRTDRARLKKLQRNLKDDLNQHGDAEKHKHLGDLLLANLVTAKRHGNKVQLTDFYGENTPTIEIEIEEESTLQAAASRYFARYAKAKRAAGEIAKRLEQVESRLDHLKQQEARLERIAANDELELKNFIETNWPSKPQSPRPKQKQAEKTPGARRYLSSDGLEILVGRASADNDHLTFRIARPNDLWLHAADYPGSHVVVRSSGRNETPQRTVIEAAQLAAKFSQARKDAKVTVHYTQRKYVSKIKGAAPGLVRLSTFKSITVEPGENVARL